MLKYTDLAEGTHETGSEIIQRLNDPIESADPMCYVDYSLHGMDSM